MAITRAVLIVGGSGFVGSHLALKLRDRYKVFATYYRKKIAIPGVTSIPLNVETRNWVKRVIYITQPDVIVYAVGSNELLPAEKNARIAERMHSVGTATVFNAADVMQPKFIYLSNCYLFDGHRGNYHETDPVLPSTTLGKAKLGGENVMRGKSLNYVVVRSSPLFGRGNGLNLSFLDHLRMALDRGQRVELLTNQIHSFAPIDGFTELVERIIDTGIRNRTLHYGGLTRVTLYDFGKMFAKKFGYDPSLILPKKIPQRKGFMVDESVADFSLNSTQVVETLKIKPLVLEEGLDLIQQKLVARL